MQIISNVALISINETIVIQLISFLIFLFFFNRIMIRPIQAVIREREVHIEKVEQDIRDAESRYETLNHQIQEQESQVRQTAREIQLKLEASGTQEATAIFTEAKQEIAEISQNAQREVAAKVKAARTSIEHEAQSLAVSIMEKVLDRRIGT